MTDRIFYSPGEAHRGFYSEQIHGPRRVTVPDESWTRPTIEVDQPGWEAPMAAVPDRAWKRPFRRVENGVTRGGKTRFAKVEDDQAVQPTVLVPDPAAKPPRVRLIDQLAVRPVIEIDNPACRIPADAVEITAERHAQLLLDNSLGKLIVPGPDGAPISVEPPPPTLEAQLKAARAWRNAELARTDWAVSASDRTLDRIQQAQAIKYRAHLRDYPRRVAEGLTERPRAPDFLT